MHARRAHATLEGTRIERQQRMSDLQARGYLVKNIANFVKERVEPAEWARASRGLSPELRQLVEGDIKVAGWYPIGQLNELSQVILEFIARGDEERARQAFQTCGEYCAREAVNTFLKLLLKMLTPGLLVKKLPDIFRRDFSDGRLVPELNGRTLTCRHYDLPGFNHCALYSSGFVIAAFAAMGKTIDSIVLRDWSLASPYVEGTCYDIVWKE
jgi:hypothetical protein